MWYPVEKYLHEGAKIIGLYDETNTGQRWWEIQVCVDDFQEGSQNLIFCRTLFPINMAFPIASCHCIYGLIKAMFRRP